jgi:hypothetical protein
MQSLDTILSGRPDAPVQEATQDETTRAAPEAEAAELTTEQQPEAQEGGEPSKDGKQAPIGAIRQAEREKATKRYTEQVADFDKRLAETNAAWERRFETLVQTLGPKPEPPQKLTADAIFENPSAFVHQEVSGPLSEVRGTLMHQARYLAEIKHTDEAVQAADDAFSKAVATNSIDPAERQRVLSSPNIYDAAVKWHRRQQVQAEIGDDPVAYKAKVEAEIMAKLQAQQQPDAEADTVTQQRSAPVMPSNFATARNVGARSGPAWAGPAPLADIFARKR